MVTLYRQPRWKIAVYGRDHGIAHFHIEGLGFRCSVAIASLELIVGTAPAPVLAAARDWARAHQVVLMNSWQELNP